MFEGNLKLRLPKVIILSKQLLDSGTCCLCIQNSKNTITFSPKKNIFLMCIITGLPDFRQMTEIP